MCHSNVNPILYRQLTNVFSLGVGLGLGLFFGAVAACSSSSPDESASSAKAKSSEAAVSGLFVSSSTGDEIGFLDFQDATHYQLARKAAGAAQHAIETGVYTLDNGMFTLTDDQTKLSQSFAFRVTETEGEPAANNDGRLLKTQSIGGGQQLVVPGSEPLLKATKVSLLNADGGAAQDLMKVAGPSFEGQEIQTMGGTLRGVKCAGPMSGVTGSKLCWQVKG